MLDNIELTDEIITERIDEIQSKIVSITSASGVITVDNEKKPIKVDINLSGIYDILIHETGRFAERYASDLLIDIKSFEKDLYEKPFEHNHKTYLFGIRRDGVDHNAYVYANIKNNKNRPGYLNMYYRKLLAVELRIDETPYSGNNYSIYVTIKDLANLII